jgi:hypothetical protein
MMSSQTSGSVDKEQLCTHLVHLTCTYEICFYEATLKQLFARQISHSRNALRASIRKDLMKSLCSKWKKFTENRKTVLSDVSQSKAVMLKSRNLNRNLRKRQQRTTVTICFYHILAQSYLNLYLHNNFIKT